MATVYSRISNLCDIDRLGEIKAQIADLTDIADGLSASIKHMGAGQHDGELFTATVTEVGERFSADPKAVSAKLKELMGDKAFERFCAANQKRTAGYVSLKLTARS